MANLDSTRQFEEAMDACESSAFSLEVYRTMSTHYRIHCGEMRITEKYMKLLYRLAVQSGVAIDVKDLLFVLESVGNRKVSKAFLYYFSCLMFWLVLNKSLDIVKSCIGSGSIGSFLVNAIPDSAADLVVFARVVSAYGMLVYPEATYPPELSQILKTDYLVAPNDLFVRCGSMIELMKKVDAGGVSAPFTNLQYNITNIARPQDDKKFIEQNSIRDCGNGTNASINQNKDLFPTVISVTYNLAHFAARYDNDVLAFLGEHQFLMSKPNSYAEYPIHEAVRYQNLSALKYYKTRVSQAIWLSVNKQFEHGNNLLHLAAQIGCPIVFRFLLVEVGISPNNLNTYGELPCHIATRSGSIEILRELISRRGLYSTKNSASNSPIHIAAIFGRLELMKLFKSLNLDLVELNRDGNTTIHLSAYNGHLDVLKYLHEECGVPIDTKNRFNDRPSHMAALRGNVEIIKYLEGKSNFSARNNDLETPLLLAYREKNFEALVEIARITGVSSSDMHSLEKCDLIAAANQTVFVH